ncbi:MAG TPA: cation:proton antiporter [Streptosporangiaceae bacterium]|nr:cation:proton antiporter [Streptosporangiaceae bacterium]
MKDPQVQLLLFDIALIIILARLLGAAAKRLGQPPVLGEIVAGILLGPTLFGGAITKALFPPTMIAPLTAIANIGLLLFMFVVGYEVDLGLVKGREKVAAGVALGSIFAPLVLGLGVGVYLANSKHVPDKLTFVLFFGVAMSITAFPVLARILTDRGMHRTRIGGLALAAASVDDVLAWTLLAVVIAIAGSKGNELRLVLAPVYVAAIIFGVRPGLRWLAGVYKRQGRLTPTVLASVLALLLLSGYATDWMGVKFIFGAFIFGIVMPRDAPALREAILERLEQVSVILLLPVFFVIAGLSVNLSGIGLSGLADLGLIMVAAVAGKFGGAYYGARLTGVRRRQAGALASLMNTRGLTELVILTVGLQLHILDKSLYTLMVVMAIVTTGMAGPLLRVIYPNRIIERDITEADRSALGRAGAHRVVVLVDDTATAGSLVDLAARIARSRSNTDVVLAHLVSVAPGERLEVGSGLGGELLQMTQTMDALHQLAARAEQRGISVVVQSRFSDDVAAELPGYIAAADPDTVVLHRGIVPLSDLSVGGKAQIVVLIKPLPDAPTAAVAKLARGADTEAALQVAAQLAVADGLDLVLSPPGRTATARVGDLGKRGIVARAGTGPAGSVLVAPADVALGAPVAAGAVATLATVNGSDGAADAGTISDPDENGGTGLGDSDADIHIAVVAGSNEASDDMDQWVEALDGHKQREGRQQ